MTEERVISERYKIIKEIGRGAMGIVYLAHDRVLARDLALKELSLSQGIPSDEREYKVKRFLREARAAGRLSHPNIVTVHDITEDGGKYYIAMEHLEGETLRHLISLGPIPVEKAIGIATQICDALHYAHDHEVVHRDIKPDNIFILKDGRVKITDFGIARILTDTTMTKAGSVVGSPGYMSPEQIMGGKIDHRTDIFALGAILYEMISAKNPFAGENITTIMYKIINEEPPAVESFCAGLPGDLSKIISKAISKDPEERFLSAEDMKKRLHDLTSGKDPIDKTPVLAPDVGSPHAQAIPVSKKPIEVSEKKTARQVSRLWIGLGLVAVAVFFLLVTRCLFAPRMIRAVKNLATARQAKNLSSSSKATTIGPVDKQQQEPVAPVQEQVPQQQTQIKIDKIASGELEAFVSAASLVPSKVTASSVRPDAKGDQKYKVDNAFDRIKETAWVGAAPSYGIGDNIGADFDKLVLLDGIGLLVSVDNTIWPGIPRPRVINVWLSDGTTFDLVLEDRPGLQAFSLSSSRDILIDSVKLKIAEVYPPIAMKPLLLNPPLAEIYFRGKIP